jgi:hypothetical protein
MIMSLYCMYLAKMPYGVLSGISILKVSLSPILTVSTSFDWLSRMRILKVVFG